MRVFFTVLYLFLICFSIEAQEIKRYQGAYISGVGQTGDANYFYYDGDRPGEQIRHGNFRYTFKIRDGNQRVYHTIEGQYKHGFKDGRWTYNLNTRDALREKDGLLSGSIDIISRYTNGIPHGKWEYTATIRHRKSDAPGSAAFTPEIKESFIISFNMGMLSDSFLFQATDGRRMEGTLPPNGMINGKWSIKDASKTKILTYSRGVFLSESITDKDGKEISSKHDKSDLERLNEFERALKSGTSRNIDFLTDTILTLSPQRNEFAALIISKFFNKSYCLIDYIPGNKYYYYDKGKLHNLLQGLGEISFKNNISPAHIEILAQLKRIEDAVKRAETDARRSASGKSLSDDAQNALRLLTAISQNVSRYYCLANAICQNYLFEDSFSDAVNGCQRRMGAIPSLQISAKSRDDALKQILSQVRSLQINANNAKSVVEKEALK